MNDHPASPKIVQIVLLAIGGGILVAAVIYQINKEFPHEETNVEKMTRYRVEANTAMLRYCTNEIVGFHHAVSAYVDELNSDDPHRWNGTVMAEYINHFGGIDWTNLVFPFKFDTDGSGRNHVEVDFVTMAKREVEAEANQKEAELQQRLENFSNAMNNANN